MQRGLLIFFLLLSIIALTGCTSTTITATQHVTVTQTERITLAPITITAFSTIVKTETVMPIISTQSAASTKGPTPTFTTTSTTSVQSILYKVRDSFTTQAIKRTKEHLISGGYPLPDRVIEWPYFARYEVIKNTDAYTGKFKIHYLLITQNNQSIQKTYSGSIEFILKPLEVKTVVSPPDGIFIDSAFLPYSHEVEITAIKQ
jgi:hypothetical protein